MKKFQFIFLLFVVSVSHAMQFESFPQIDEKSDDDSEYSDTKVMLRYKVGKVDLILNGIMSLSVVLPHIRVALFVEDMNAITIYSLLRSAKDYLKYSLDCLPSAQSEDVNKKFLMSSKRLRKYLKITNKKFGLRITIEQFFIRLNQYSDAYQDNLPIFYHYEDLLSYLFKDNGKQFDRFITTSTNTDIYRPFFFLHYLNT